MITVTTGVGAIRVNGSEFGMSESERVLVASDTVTGEIHVWPTERVLHVVIDERLDAMMPDTGHPTTQADAPFNGLFNIK